MAKQPTLVWDDAPSSTPTKPVKLIFDDEFKPASSTVPSKPPAALAPAKRPGKQKTVSWLGEKNLPVVGEFRHPHSAQALDVIKYPTPTQQDPQSHLLLVSAGPNGNPYVVEPDGKGGYKRKGSFRPAGPAYDPAADMASLASMQANDDAQLAAVRGVQGRAAAVPKAAPTPAQSPSQAPAAPSVQHLASQIETLKKWKKDRPGEVEELERDFTKFYKFSDNNEPDIAAIYAQSAEAKFAKLLHELGAPDRFVSQREQVQMGMVEPPQVVRNDGAGGQVSAIGSLAGSETQGFQSSAAGMGEQFAQRDAHEQRVAEQSANVSGNAAWRAAESFGNAAEGFGTGALRLIPGTPEAFDKWLDERSRKQGAFADANARAAGEGVGGNIERIGQGIAASYGAVAPGAAIGALTGGTATGMALSAGLSTYGSAMQEAHDAGLRGESAQRYGTGMALMEIAPSLLATKVLKIPGLEGAFVKSGVQPKTFLAAINHAAKKIVSTGLQEILDETATLAGQDILAILENIDPNRIIMSGERLGNVIAQSFLGAAAANAAGGGHVKNVWKSAWNSADIRSNGKKYVEPASGPADWAKAHPEKADEIVAAVEAGKPISRSMMEANSLPTMGSVKRSKWAADVHAAVKNQVADAAGLGEAVAATHDTTESQNPIPTEVQRSEDLRGRIDAERASQAAAVRNLGPEYEQRAQAIEAGAEDAAIAQDIERRMAEEESAPFSNSPKPKGPQFVNNAQPIEDAAEGSFGAPQTGDEVVDTREVEGKAGKGTRRGRVVSVEGDWATVQPKFGKQYKVPVGRLEVRGRPGTPKAKGLQEQPVGEGEDFVTPMGGSLSRNTVAEQNQQQGQADNVAQPDLAELTSPEQPAPPAQPQAEVPPTQQAEVGEPAPAPQSGVGERTIQLDDMEMNDLRRKGFSSDQIAMMDDATLKKNGVVRVNEYNLPPLKGLKGGFKKPANNPAKTASPALTQGQQIRVISRAYPGTEIKPVAGEQGRYTVTLPNGKFLTVLYTPEVVEGPANRERLRQSLEARSGRPPTEAELDNATVTGFWRVSDGKGFETDGQGLVRILDSLGEGQATATALHEARHSLVSMGLMTEAEFDALAMEAARKSGQKPKTIADAEEMIAALAEKGDLGARGFIQTIRDIINRFMAAITGDRWKPNAQTATKRIQSGKVLRRAGKTESRREAAGRLSAEVGSDVRYSAGMNNPLQVESVDLSKFGWREQDDDYIYHVTSKPNADRIAKSGFSRGKSMFTAGSYPAYSKGKTFFTDRSGVKYWEDRVEQQLFHSHDDPPDVAVVRIPKSLVADMLQDDKTGTDDAKHNAYYIDTNKLTVAQKKAAGGGADDAEVGGDVRYAAAFHGSPHTFDKFSTSKMGTGEGAQAYGWGLYFAGKKAVAEHYRDTLSKPQRTIEQKAMDEYDADYDSSEAGERLLARTDLTPVERRLLEALQADDWLGFDYPHQAVKAVMRKGSLENLDPSQETRDAVAEAKKPQGRVYHVDLKPEEEDYLNWGKPLNEQSEKVRKAIAPLVEDLKKSASESDPAWGDLAKPEMVESLRTGGDLYSELSYLSEDGRGPAEKFGGIGKSAKQAASEYLKSIGVRGIKYLDGDSRSKGFGSHNYVIFDDADVDITEMYSAELAGAKPDDAKDKAAAAKAWREQGTESPWFKRWFGKSKVVDAEGKPLVVYHGTTEDFSEFKKAPPRTNHPSAELGFFFTESPHIAGMFNRDLSSAGPFADVQQQPFASGARTVPAYLSIKNPKVLSAREFKDLMVADSPTEEHGWSRTPQGWADLRKGWESEGYDGIKIGTDTNQYRGSGNEEYAMPQYVAFKPTQIKSATGNNGTFSPDNADIRYSADPSQAKKERAARLSNPGTSQVARDLVDETRLNTDVPAGRSIEASRKNAQAMLDADTPALLAKLETGALTGDEDLAVQLLINERALKANTDAERAAVSDLVLKRDVARSEAGYQLRVGRDPQETPYQRHQRLLNGLLFEATPSQKKDYAEAKRKAKDPRTPRNEVSAYEKVAAGIKKQIDDRLKRNREYLEKRGLLPKGGHLLNDVLGNRNQIRKIIAEASAHEASIWAKLREFRLVSMLSAPASWARNLSSTPVHHLFRHVAVRGVKAATDTLVGGSPLKIGKRAKRHARSFAHYWANAQTGDSAYEGKRLGIARAALRMAADSFINETNELEARHGFDSLTQGGLVENIDGKYAISGPKGKFVRAFGYGVSRFFDQLEKSWITSHEVARQAFNIAYDEGYEGDAMDSRIEELVLDPHSVAWERAIAEANFVAFSGESGFATQAAKKFVAGGKKTPLVNLFFEQILPFANTTMNIASETAEYIPAVGFGKRFVGNAIKSAFGKGKNSLDGKRLRDLSYWLLLGDNLRENMSDTAAKQAVFMMLYGTAAAAGLFSDDDDDEEGGLLGIKIRSSYHPTKPLTIRIGSKDLSYKGLEPIGTILGLMADGYQANRMRKQGRVGAVKAAGLAAVSAKNQVISTPLLRGLSDLMRLAVPSFDESKSLEDGTDAYERSIGDFSKSFVLTWVPAILKKTGEATREHKRIRKAGPKDDSLKSAMYEWGNQVLDESQVSTVLESFGVKEPGEIQKDAFGRPVRISVFDNAFGDFVYRMMSPFNTTREDIHPAQELIARYNRERPLDADRYAMPTFNATYTDKNGDRVPFNREQSERFRQIAGDAAAEMFKLGKFNKDAPVDALAEQVDHIKEILKRSGAKAREMLEDEIRSGKPIGAVDAKAIAQELHKDIYRDAVRGGKAKVRQWSSYAPEDWKKQDEDEKALKKRSMARGRRDRLRE